MKNPTKEQVKEWNARYYQNSKEAFRQVRIERKTKARELARSNLKEFLTNKSCKDCGNIDLRILEFDHLRDKKFDISRMVASGTKWERILNEINKCDIVCRNCHALRTYEREKSHRYYW